VNPEHVLTQLDKISLLKKLRYFFVLIKMIGIRTMEEHAEKFNADEVSFYRLLANVHLEKEK